MANDFTGNAVALWRMENGALTTDFLGGNTLTNRNTVTNNTTDYKEGSASADLEASSSQGLHVTDTNLDSGVPYKSGEANRDMTICVWFRFESLPGSDSSIVSKYDANSNDRSFRLKVESADNKFYWASGYNNGDSFQQSAAFGTAFQTGRWYHLGATLDSSNNYRARIWDDTAGNFLDSDLTGTFANAVSITTAPICIGMARKATTGFEGYHDGEIDEVVIFDRILSTTEIDQVRAGTFGAAGQFLTQDLAWQVLDAIERNTGWGILAAKTADTSYRILNAIDRDVAAKILTATDQDTAYRILNAVTRDTASKIFTSLDRDSSWAILAKAERDTSWNILNRIDRDLAWQILLANVLELDIAWQILTSAEIDLDIAWAIKTAKEQITGYRIMAAKDQDTAWGIANAVTRDIAWSILNAKDQQTAWDLLAQISRDSSWKVFNITDQDLAWDILNHLEQDTGWQLFDAASLDTAWDVLSDIVPEPIKVFMAEQRTFIFNAEQRTFVFNADRRTFIFFA